MPHPRVAPGPGPCQLTSAFPQLVKTIKIARYTSQAIKYIFNGVFLYVVYSTNRPLKEIEKDVTLLHN